MSVVIDCLTTIETEMGPRKLMSSDFKSFGDSITIYPQAKFVNPGVIEIGDNTVIDDFTFLYGGNSMKLGRYLHIGSFSSVIGGGDFIMEDYSGFAVGVRIITGTDIDKGGFYCNGAMPLELRNCVRSFVHLEKGVFLGTNVIVHPGVTIGEGCIVGSNSLVTKDLEPWGIYIGSPAKRVRERERLTVCGC